MSTNKYALQSNLEYSIQRHHPKSGPIMLTTKNRSESLRETIEEMIAVGELRPGQHLDETDLAIKFGVSRTPVREALIQLASMGIVVTRPRRGTVVAEIDPRQLVASSRRKEISEVDDVMAASIAPVCIAA